MSRCKACDAPLYLRDTPAINQHTGQEEELCGVCRGESKYATVPHEYVGGCNPQEGVRHPDESYLE